MEERFFIFVGILEIGNVISLQNNSEQGRRNKIRTSEEKKEK